MVDPKFTNNNHLINDLKEEDNSVSEAVQNYRNQKGKKSDPLKEKMMKRLLIIAIVAVVLILALFFLSSFVSGNKSYSEVENIMIQSAKKYYEKNASLLPKISGGTVEVSAEKLIEEKYMKAFKTYLKKDQCSGKVVVEKQDQQYIYIPYLNCGESYQTIELYRKVIDSNPVVSTGSGLYVNGNEYVFKGEKISNYVSIQDENWRIVKITADREVVLIKQDKISDSMSVAWDNRYNSDRGYAVGINDFSISRIRDTLKKVYEDQNGKVFSQSVKNHIVDHAFCVGKRLKNTLGSDFSSECSVTSDPLKVGLLSVSDYMNASLDSNCNSTLSMSCQNYNYLVNGDFSWWLLTANSENNYQAYYVTEGGVVGLSNASSFKKIRPVIYLDDKTMFASGDGTKDYPYLIK